MRGYRVFVLAFVASLLLHLFPSSAAPASAQGNAALRARPPSTASFTPPAPAPASAPIVRADGPLLPTFSLDVATQPRVRVGQTVPFTITLTNLSANPGDDVVLSLPTLDGAEIVTVPTAAQGQDGVRWDVGHLDAGETRELSGVVRVLTMPYGRALLLKPSVLARGLAAPVTKSGGALVDPADSRAVEVQFTPGSGVSLRSGDGRFELRFSGRGFGRTLRLRHTPYAIRRAVQAASALPSDSVDGQQGFGTFFLDASDAKRLAVHLLDAPATFVLSYTDQEAEVLGLDQQHLTLNWFNEEAQAWRPIPTTVDTQNHTATAQVDHFSAYNFSNGISPSAAYIPSLQGFQLSNFTGAATYNVPIAVPAGPGGQKPRVSLSYSSAASDGMNGARALWQAGVVGKGWSLDAGGAVARNVSQGSNDGQWDHFTLVFDGRSFDMVKNQLLTNPGCTLSDNPATTVDEATQTRTNPSCWSWHATDDAFVKLRKSSTADTWTAWTKDGTRYEFNRALVWGITPSAYQTYKWLLTKVVDTHGNVITYDYQVDNAPGRTDVQPTSYLRTISWAYDGATAGTGNPRYQISFNTRPRNSDDVSGVDANWEYSTSRIGGKAGTPHEAYRVDDIIVRAKGPGATDFQQVRRYHLNYYTGTSSVASDVSGGQRVLTLQSVQLINATDTAGLPATTFTYEMTQGNTLEPNPGWNRLLSVDNGQGGKLSFTYEHVWRQGPIDYAKYYQNYYRVGSVLREETSGQPYARQYRTDYIYTAPALNDEAYAATVSYAFHPTAGNADNAAYLAHPNKSEFRGHSSVTARSYDGPTNSSPLLREEQWWFHQGNGGSNETTCNPLNSAGKVDESGQCFKTMVERESWKGRVFQHEVRSGGVLLSRDQHSFTRVELPWFGDSATAASSNNYKRVGLWRAFNAESQTTETTFDPGGASTSKVTSYTYDTSASGYGNLQTVTECLNTCATTTNIVRKISHWYVTRDDAISYIVDRRWQSGIRDNQDRFLTLSAFFYDDGTSTGTIGSRGELTRQVAYTDVPLATSLSGVTLHGQDTTFDYDDYGNTTRTTTYDQTSTRTYNGSVVTYSAPGGNARNTLTVYDTTFHAFSTQVTNPLGHVEQAEYDYRLGVLIKVRGPNAVAAGQDVACANSNTYSIDANYEITCAQYDNFGRITKLVRPDDSSNLPTIDYTYYDTSKPVIVLVGKRERWGSADGWQPAWYAYNGFGEQVQTKVESADGSQTIVQDILFDGLGRIKQRSQPRYVNETPATTFWGYTPSGASLYRPTTTTFDGLGRVLSETTPSGTTQMSYGVDGEGMWAKVVDPNSHATTDWSDALGRQTIVREYTGTTSPRALYATTRYTYDPLDRLTATLDAQGNQTSITYDSLGHKKTMVDPDMGSWSYSYWGSGTLASQLNASGQATSFSYDALDRLRSIDYPSGEDSWYTYDEAGALHGIGQRTSTCSALPSSPCTVYQRWEYDGRGRVTFAGQTYTKQVSHKLRYDYDSADRLRRQKYEPTDEYVTTTYDAAWRPTSVCSSIANQSCYVSSATYDALSQPTARSYGNGLVQQWSYEDPTARLQWIRLGSSNAPESLMKLAHSYDAVGNLKRIDNYTANQSLGETPNRSFEYDDLNRLTRAYGQTYDESYSYDLVGNLTNKAGVSMTYGTNGNGTGARPHAPKTVGATNYSYDNNGNLSNTYQGTDPNSTGRYYDWDPANRLLSVGKRAQESKCPVVGPGPLSAQQSQLGPVIGGGGGSSVCPGGGSPVTTTTYTQLERYLYDADSNRAARVANGQTTVYAWGAWEDTLGVGSRKLYSFNGEVVAQRDSTGVTYLHGDHLGSVSLATNSSGALMSKQEFDPWGKVRSGNVSQTTINYTRQHLDSTGLLFYNARYYDPAIGRFLSADSVVPGNASGGMEGIALRPLTVDFHEVGFVNTLNTEGAYADKLYWGGPANSQSLNRYSYVQNNPLRWTDPTGHILEGGDEIVGYRSVCENSQGKRTNCGTPGSQPVRDPVKGELVEAWTYNVDNLAYTYTYYYSNSDEFKQFADYAAKAEAAKNATIGAGVTGLLSAGAVAGGCSTLASGISIAICGAGVVGLVGSAVWGYNSYKDWMQNWRAAEILQRQSSGVTVSRNGKPRYMPHRSQTGPLPLDP